MIIDLKRKSVVFLVLLLLLAVGCSLAPETPKYDGNYSVVIIMGQSNADGFAYSSYLPLNIYKKYANGLSPYKIAYSVGIGTNESIDFVPVRIGQGFYQKFSGPEIGIAEELEANDIPAFIIKWSCQATDLDTLWLKDPCLYDKAMSFIKNRLDWLISCNIHIDNICVCWMQGEADDNPTFGPKYEANTEILVNKLKEDLDRYCNNHFYFIDACIQGAWSTYGYVNAAKESFAAKHKDFVSLIPDNPSLITCSIAKQPNTWGGSCDGMHFDMQGEYNLGREFIKRFLQLIK